MKAFKVTPWFPEQTKPVHVGVYQVHTPYAPTPGSPRIGYSMWDGRGWSAWSWDADTAATSNFRGEALCWRGLATDPRRAR